MQSHADVVLTLTLGRRNTAPGPGPALAAAHSAGTAPSASPQTWGESSASKDGLSLLAAIRAMSMPVTSVASIFCRALPVEPDRVGADHSAVVQQMLTQ